MEKSDHQQDARPTICKPAHRRRLGLLLCALIGVVLLLVVRQNGRSGLPADPEYGLLLTLPWHSARVMIDTKRGDNLAAAVEEVLQEDQTEWREILGEKGELDFELVGEVRKQVPLGTRVRWLRTYHRWYPEITPVRVGLPHVWLRDLAGSTDLRGSAGLSGREAAGGRAVRHL